MATSVATGERLLEGAVRLSGDLLTPADPAYEETRRVHNGLIDRHPAAIVRCRGTADVADAVRLARSCDLEISVRGGGHNVAGRAVTEGGLMVDLSPMRGVHIDPAARTARVQGGVLWRELNREAAVHGLAVTGGAISTTGVAGLTLGGGLGWLMGLHGLAADNLIEVELVTAAGDVLTVNDRTHGDLMWALRGGGGNFGVATWLTFRLHPLRTVVGGLIAHPVDAAPDVIRFVRDNADRCPDALTVWVGLAYTPDGSTPIAAILICHAGERRAAERDLAAYRDFGAPLMTEVGPMPYPVMNTLLDDGFPWGAFNYWRSSFSDGLPDELIDTAVRCFAETPSPLNAVVFEHFHGAVTRPGATDTAVPHREPGWNVVLPSVWTDAGATADNVRWTRETFAAMQEHLAPRRWLNYLGDDEEVDAVRAAYGPNYDRLVDVKRRYDPENVLHLNQNISP